MQPPIPIPVLKNLRCGHCHKYVSCGPVHVTPDSSVLCGRCVRFAKPIFRNLAFETIASIYRYPCHYWPKHCNKKLVWNESLEHERNCLFESGCSVFCSRPGTYFKSDRKLPNNAELNLEHLSDDVVQNLKCANCDQYLSNGPVYLVSDGQNVCHRCIHANGAPKGAVRNLAYETIAASVIFPCLYRFRGCPIRLQFGREMWGHENECPYGQVQRPVYKKTSRAGDDVRRGVGEEKHKGVIETHSGHYWGTITPHSALFAPPKTKHNDGKIVTQELTEVMKKKQEERNFDSQSMDSMVSRASTFDSIADNISRDNISRSTADNISRDNISRSTVDNISRASSRMQARYSHETILNEEYPPEARASRQQKMSRSSDDVEGVYNHGEGRGPLPTPTGYNRIPFNGYYQENVARYGRPSSFDPNSHLFHYPPIYQESPLAYSGSFNYGSPVQAQPKRNESFRVGNQDIIDELRERHSKKQQEENPYNQCNNLQELVQKHDEVAH